MVRFTNEQVEADADSVREAPDRASCGLVPEEDPVTSSVSGRGEGPAVWHVPRWRQSLALHGDVQRAAEMTAPAGGCPASNSGLQEMMLGW